VARIVAVDIGDYNSKALQRALSPKAKSQVWAYQVWLALAWVLGRHISARVGNRMTRWMARAAVLPLMTSAGAWGDSLARGGFGFMGSGRERERSRGRCRRFACAALADAGERGK
jgi:hypothetical protein